MKRFSGTEKWSKPWFRKLSPKLKCFIQYFWDNCDCAGVWTVDLELAAMFIGEPVTEKEIFLVLGERIQDLGNGKWLERDFIPFQYGELSDECKAHRPVFKAVTEYGLERTAKGYSKGMDTHKEKEKEKEKDKDKEKEKEKKREQALEIYAEYPKKVNRDDALKAIVKALDRVDALMLRQRTALFAQCVRGCDMQFVPYPASWFNAGGYESDPNVWKEIGRETQNGKKYVNPDLL